MSHSKAQLLSTLKCDFPFKILASMSLSVSEVKSGSGSLYFYFLLVAVLQACTLYYIAKTLLRRILYKTDIKKYFEWYGRTFMHAEILAVNSDCSFNFVYKPFWFAWLAKQNLYRCKLLGISAPLGRPEAADIYDYLRFLTHKRMVVLELCSFVKEKDLFYVVLYTDSTIANLEVLRGGYAKLCRKCLGTCPEYNNVFENAELLAKKQHIRQWKLPPPNGSARASDLTSDDM
ncbi:hypothetical protein PAPHI01_1868 [Pancytospora philotis]|nr:hypothetical protein PAPHI01_1868 [Pancytospora philotis]